MTQPGRERKMQGKPCLWGRDLWQGVINVFWSREGKWNTLRDNILKTLREMVFTKHLCNKSFGNRWFAKRDVLNISEPCGQVDFKGKNWGINTVWFVKVRVGKTLKMISTTQCFEMQMESAWGPDWDWSYRERKEYSSPSPPNDVVLLIKADPPCNYVNSQRKKTKKKRRVGGHPSFPPSLWGMYGDNT